MQRDDHLPALKLQSELFILFGKKNEDELLLSCPSFHLLSLLPSPALYIPSLLITNSFPPSHCPDPGAPAPPSLRPPPPLLILLQHLVGECVCSLRYYTSLKLVTSLTVPFRRIEPCRTRGSAERVGALK